MDEDVVAKALFMEESDSLMDAPDMMEEGLHLNDGIDDELAMY